MLHLLSLSLYFLVLFQRLEVVSNIVQHNQQREHRPQFLMTQNEDRVSKQGKDGAKRGTNIAYGNDSTHHPPKGMNFLVGIFGDIFDSQAGAVDGHTGSELDAHHLRRMHAQQTPAPGLTLCWATSGSGSCMSRQTQCGGLEMKRVMADTCTHLAVWKGDLD